MKANNVYKQQSKLNINRESIYFYNNSILTAIAYIDNNLIKDAFNVLSKLLDAFTFSSDPTVEKIINILLIVCLELESEETIDCDQIKRILNNLLIT